MAAVVRTALVPPSAPVPDTARPTDQPTSDSQEDQAEPQQTEAKVETPAQRNANEELLYQLQRRGSRPVGLTHCQNFCRI